MKGLIALTVAFALTMGCSKSPTSPSPPGGRGGLSGTWTGTLSDTANGSGSMRLVLTDLGTFGGITGVSGTWAATFGDASKNGSGQVSGTTTGGILRLTLQASTRPTCVASQPFSGPPGNYAASLAMDNGAIRGPYVFATCSGEAVGALDLRKQ